ncbi:alpha/beta hydrolase family protein [Kitasatospora sp. NPDC017646]|uniref:alpha/beta hydrolase family protein n=1 Tax=Kitasatospora sp. NPDC017646 TaxID=3364024 RepID=UPI003799F609
MTTAHIRRAAGRALAALLLALPVCLAWPRSAFAADALTRTEVTFQGGDGLTLHGTIVEPAGGHDALPGVVLVGGAGPGPREEYRAEAEGFARAGVATLVYDKRTAGYSTMHRDFGLLAEDASAGVRVLRTHPGVRPDAVGLWGFSEGGWVAPLAATRSPDIAFVITIGGSGLSPLRTQTWNLDTHLAHRGAPGSLLGAIDGPGARLLDGAGLFPEADYDPLPVLEHLHQPVLALWGEYDTKVPPQESARIFRTVLAEAGNDHVTIAFVPGAGHNGHRSSDGFDSLGGPTFQGHPLGELGPGYLDVMASWTEQVAAGHPLLSSTAPAPAQKRVSHAATADPWYQQAGTGRTALAALVAAYLAGPLVGSLRRAPAPLRRRVRWLAVLGTADVVAAPLFVMSVFATDGKATGPVVAGRPALWLLLQAATAAVLVLTVAVALAAWRERRALAVRTRVAVAVHLAAGVVLVPWALGWGLA